MQAKVKTPEKGDWATWPVHMNCTVKPDGAVRVDVLVQGSASVHEVHRSGEGDTVMSALHDAFFEDESDPREGGIAAMMRVAFILGCQCGNGGLPVMVEDENKDVTDGFISYNPPAEKL